MTDTTADAGADIVAALDATDPTVQTQAAEQAAATDADLGFDTTDEADTADETIEGEDALGDAGKQALERMKQRLKDERSKRREAESKLSEVQPTDDAERIQREADSRALAKANDRILRAEVRAAATGKLADPADALIHIDVTQFEVDDDGTTDEAEIVEAITELIAKKPYLAAQSGTRKTPAPDPSQGAAGKGTASTAERFASSLDGIL